MNDETQASNKDKPHKPGGYVPIISGDPVRDQLNRLHISPNHDDLQKALAHLSPKPVVIEESNEQQENPHSDLSPFTRWLQQLPDTRFHRDGMTVEVETPTPSATAQAVEPSSEGPDSHGSTEVSSEISEERTIPEEHDQAEKHQTKKSKKSKSEKEKRKKKKAKKAARKRAKRQTKEVETMPLADDVFSETLAKLLAERGYPDQAIIMYEKLGLIYPEKSRLFAAKIEELKQQK